MRDVTALAEAYFRAEGLSPSLRQIVIAAFEAGYLTHRHDDPQPVSASNWTPVEQLGQPPESYPHWRRQSVR